MNAKKLSSTKKISSIFLVALVLAMLVSTGLNLYHGDKIGKAIWKSLTEIRPMEIILFFIFWYMAVPDRWRNQKDNKITTLNLTDR